MNKKSVTLDFTNFNRMMTHLAKLTGTDLLPIFQHELGRALSEATKRTKVADRGKLAKKYTLKGSVQAYKDVENGKAGSQYPSQDSNLVPKIRIGSSEYKLPADIKSTNFGLIKKEIAIKRKKKQNLCGLAQASIYATALKACPKDYTPTGNAKKAHKNNTALVNGFVDVQTNKIEPSISIAINCKSLAYGTNGEKTIHGAMRGREQFMATNIEKGVFDHAEKSASKYGFIVVP